MLHYRRRRNRRNRCRRRSTTARRPAPRRLLAVERPPPRPAKTAAEAVLASTAAQGEQSRLITPAREAAALRAEATRWQQLHADLARQRSTQAAEVTRLTAEVEAHEAAQAQHAHQQVEAAGALAHCAPRRHAKSTRCSRSWATSRRRCAWRATSSRRSARRAPPPSTRSPPSAAQPSARRRRRWWSASRQGRRCMQDAELRAARAEAEAARREAEAARADAGDVARARRAA